MILWKSVKERLRIIKMKDNVNKQSKSNWKYVFILILTTVFFTSLQFLFYWITKIDFSVLEKDFIEIYSFIVSVLSLFGVYFAIIQFSLQMKGDRNIYFGIDYVSYLQNNSQIYQFSTSNTFFTSLLLFTTLPIISKLGIFSVLLEKIWNSICLFLLCLFILLLYEGLNQIIEITDENKTNKQDIIYNEKVKKINELLQSLYNKENEKMPESSRIQYFFMHIKYEVNIIIKSNSMDSEFEKQYYLNNLLYLLDAKGKISPERIVYFLREYLKMLNEYEIELLFNSKEPHIYYYPLLEGFTSMHKKIENNANLNKYINELYDFLKKQKYIESPLLIQFVLDNPHLFLKVNLHQLTDFLDLIVYSDSFSIEELEFQLFNLGKSKDFVESDISKLVCNVWNYLFEMYDQQEMDLLLPDESLFEFQSFFGTKTELIYENNWYSKVLEDYVEKNPESTLKDCKL